MNIASSILSNSLILNKVFVFNLILLLLIKLGLYRMAITYKMFMQIFSNNGKLLADDAKSIEVNAKAETTKMKLRIKYQFLSCFM